MEIREGVGWIAYSGASSEGLDQAALGDGFGDIVDGKLLLDHIDGREHALAPGEPLARELQDATSGDTIQDDLISQGSSYQLGLAFPGLPHDEEVRCSGFRHGAVQQPEDLVVAPATASLLAMSEGP